MSFLVSDLCETQWRFIPGGTLCESLQVAEQPGNNKTILEGQRTSWRNKQQLPEERGSNFSLTYLHNFERLENRSPTWPDAALLVGVTVLEEHILDGDPKHGEVGG